MRLGDVLRPVARAELNDPTKTYKLLGVRLDGRGPFLRETVLGSETAAGKFYRVESGDFIYSRLFAWRGAFGTIDDEMDGCYVSGEFPTFRPLDGNVDVRYLRWWFRLAETLRRVEEDCSGSTPLTRNRFKEHFFLDLEIPLPSLDEQERIVARIEGLSAMVAEGQALQQRTAEEGEALLRAILASDPEAKLTPMRDLLRLRDPDVAVHPNESYQFAGVYSFGRGVFRAQQRSGMETAYSRLTRVHAGDLVYPKLMAWEGAFGVVPDNCEGCVVSTEFPVFQVDRGRVSPEILDVHFRDPHTWAALSGSSTGTNVRRRRLNPRDFLAYEFPVPSVAIQLKLRAVHELLASVRMQQNDCSAELNALLPAVLDRALQVNSRAGCQG